MTKNKGNLIDTRFLKWVDADHEGFCCVRRWRRRTYWLVCLGVILVLGAGAWCVVQLRIENAGAKNAYPFVHQRIAEMRAEREIEHKQEVIKTRACENCGKIGVEEEGFVKHSYNSECRERSIAQSNKIMSEVIEKMTEEIEE